VVIVFLLQNFKTLNEQLLHETQFLLFLNNNQVLIP
jgi:hypothetical protein